MLKAPYLLNESGAISVCKFKKNIRQGMVPEITDDLWRKDFELWFEAKGHELINYTYHDLYNDINNAVNETFETGCTIVPMGMSRLTVELPFIVSFSENEKLEREFISHWHGRQWKSFNICGNCLNFLFEIL